MGWYPWYRPAHGDSNGAPCPYSLGRSASLTSYGGFAAQHASLFAQTGNLWRKSSSHSPNAKGHAGVESAWYTRDNARARASADEVGFAPTRYPAVCRGGNLPW